MQLWQLSATELAARYRHGSLLPSAVLTAVWDRLMAVNPAINAYATLDEAGARCAAALSDARFAAGTPRGAFDGIPLGIKDNITVGGMRCAWGSELWQDFVPDRDETPVARLRAQGAVVLGKTNVSEFTLGRGNTDTRLFGTTRNPWDLALTPGASTGGGAAGVAAGIGPVALGTDGGGSIRRPACHCGLLGLKPTTGRVARIDGLPPILHDAEVIGPLARSVDDIAMVLTAIQGRHDEDRLSYPFDATDAEAALPSGLSILYLPQVGDWPVDAPVAESCAVAARRMAALGHRVETVAAPFDVALFDTHWPVITAAGVAWLLRGKAWRGRIGATYEEMAEMGAGLSAAQYQDALAAFRELHVQFARAFRRWDIIMTPTAGALPWPAEQFGQPHNRAFTGWVNAAGLPAINVPCDPSPEGLPIGAQFIAPFGQDWLLVALARQIEAAHPWAQRWPAL